MLKNIPKAPRPLQSPRRYTLRPSHKNNCNVDQEYQIDTAKNTKKKQPSISKYQSPLSPNTSARKLVKRKLSLRKNSQTEGQVSQSPKAKADKTEKQETGRVDSTQLALQIEYNQFNNKKKIEGEKDTNEGETTILKKKIRRIRSSSTFQRQNKCLSQNYISNQKLQKVKKQNQRLKERKTETLIRLHEVELMEDREKREFEAEIAAYQRQMQALKNQISKNKTQFCHLYYYQGFDPLKMAVNPILEVDAQSSRFQSMVKESEIKELHFESKSNLGRFSKNSDRKELLTQTTDPASREEYGEFDIL